MCRSGPLQLGVRDLGTGIDVTFEEVQRLYKMTVAIDCFHRICTDSIASVLCVECGAFVGTVGVVMNTPFMAWRSALSAQ
jgi:hypothetical protein